MWIRGRYFLPIVLLSVVDALVVTGRDASIISTTDPPLMRRDMISDLYRRQSNSELPAVKENNVPTHCGRVKC
jgi:hypothetical protein